MKNEKLAMMKVILFLFSASLIVFTVTTCYYDSVEFLYPETSAQCDTSHVGYSSSVVPVLQTYCLTCHNNKTAASLGGNIRLENYADVKARANDHKLLGSIAHENGYSPMPKDASKLENCKITVIRLWINAGAPNK